MRSKTNQQTNKNDFYSKQHKAAGKKSFLALLTFSLIKTADNARNVSKATARLSVIRLTSTRSNVSESAAMSLIKLCASRHFNKTLPIKNLKFLSSSSQAAERAKKTSLFDFHVARGGKIVNFAGYLLPVQYADQGIVQSHVHTRTPGCASIFDVGARLSSVAKKLNKLFF